MKQRARSGACAGSCHSPPLSSSRCMVSSSPGTKPHLDCCAAAPTLLLGRLLLRLVAEAGEACTRGAAPAAAAASADADSSARLAGRGELALMLRVMRRRGEGSSGPNAGD